MDEDGAKNKVPAFVWYFVLEFNDKDRWTLMAEMFNGEMKLRNLTVEQFWQLFEAISKLLVEKKGLIDREL